MANMQISILAGHESVSKAFKQVLRTVAQYEIVDLGITKYYSGEDIFSVDDFRISWPTAKFCSRVSKSPVCHRFIVVCNDGEKRDKIIDKLFLLSMLRLKSFRGGVFILPFHRMESSSTPLQVPNFLQAKMNLYEILERLESTSGKAVSFSVKKLREMYLRSLYDFAHEMKNGMYYKPTNAWRYFEFFKEALECIWVDASRLEAVNLQILVKDSQHILYKYPNLQGINAGDVHRGWELLMNNPDQFIYKSPYKRNN
jgi:hypothetical protein